MFAPPAQVILEGPDNRKMFPLLFILHRYNKVFCMKSLVKKI